MSTRIKSGFLFLPKIINGRFRWLVFAKWKQRSVNILVFDENRFQEKKCWVDVKWI